MGYKGNNLTTRTTRLYVARNEADENGAPGAPAAIVLATESDFAHMPTTALDLAKKDLFLPKDGQVFGELEQNGLAFSFSGSGAANKTFTYDIYAWAAENGPAKHIVNGTGTLGTQQVVVYPHNGVATSESETRYWADTLVVTWENHLKEVESTDIVGHNSIAEVWFDGTGLRYIFIEISDADGSSEGEAGDVACFYRYF